MEKSDSIPDESAEASEIIEETEIDKIIKIFLESEQDLNISTIFSNWILEFIKQEGLKDPESNVKLYDVFEQWNHSLIRQRSSITGSGDTLPTKPSHFEIEASLIEEVIKKAVIDFKIFKFMQSSKWNELRVEFCGKDEINYECIESLEKLIMFQNLMEIKKDKYRLTKGW